MKLDCLVLDDTERLSESEGEKCRIQSIHKSPPSFRNNGSANASHHSDIAS